MYSDWVDACDAVAKDTANKYEDLGPYDTHSHNRAGSPGEPGNVTGVDEG